MPVDAAARLLQALVTQDAAAAIDVVERARATGLTTDELFDALYAPALSYLGGAWASGGIDETTFALAAALAEQIAPFVVPPAVPRDRGVSVVIGTAKGEAHDALKNIIAAALAEDGYRVSDLGLGVPLWEFLAAIEQTGSRVVIVCVETLVALPDVALIRERLARRGRDDVVLLVAGGPFAADPQLARSSGANGVITGASSAMRALSRVAADLLDGGRA